MGPSPKLGSGVQQDTLFDVSLAMVPIVRGPKSSSQGHLIVSDAKALIAAGVGTVSSDSEHIDGRQDSHPPARDKAVPISSSEHLQDLSKPSLTAVDGHLRGLRTWCPIESLPAILQKPGEPWSAFWNQSIVREQLALIAPSPAPETTKRTPVDETSQPPTPSSDTVIPTYRISDRTSQEIDEYLNDFITASPTKAYKGFLAGYSIGFYPTVVILGRLINALGRSGEIKKVSFVYEVAQHTLTANKALRGEDPNGPWCHIEDHTIIALAHAGNVEGTHNHRYRIFGCGSTPGADAYGALTGRDTTDDSTDAYTLYRESQIHGVIPNVYLYNTMISKMNVFISLLTIIRLPRSAARKCLGHSTFVDPCTNSHHPRLSRPPFRPRYHFLSP